MKKLLSYLVIFAVSFGVLFIMLAAEMQYFNGTVDYSVVLGTTVVMSIILTLFCMAFLELLLRGKHLTYKPAAALWIALIIVCAAVYTAAPDLYPSAVFYGLPAAVAVLVLTPVMRRLRG